MTDPTLVAEIADLIRDVAQLPSGIPIAAETQLVEDLGIDSFDLASIIFAVQDHYDLAVRGDELPPIQDVGELVAYVVGHLKPVAA